MSDALIRIVLHDYSGHPHTSRLARALCNYGFDVSYVSFAGFSTPKGKVQSGADDPPNFRATELRISGRLDKDNLFRRMLHQQEYAAVLQQFVKSQKPDIVISANSPPEIQEALVSSCKRLGAAFVFWCQDINSEAIGRILAKKNRLIGQLAGTYYRMKERKLIQKSDAVIVIAEGFRRVFAAAPWNIKRSDIHVIENIAPLDEVPLLPRDNDWSVANMRPNRRRIVYTGTLARKHNPEMLLALARDVDADVWLFSEGSSPDYVAAEAKARGLDNLFVRPWLSVENLPKALAAADLLYAIIEADAGVFSVPSKVLSYLAAGRSIIASLPRQNLACETIVNAGAGLVSEPTDEAGLIANARQLMQNEPLRLEMGANGRRFAETHFDVDQVAKRFTKIIQGATSTRDYRAPAFQKAAAASVKIAN